MTPGTRLGPYEVLTLLGAGMSLSMAPPSEQNDHKLVGTWKLVEASATSSTGVINRAPYGATVTGTLVYTPDRRVVVLVSYGGRKPMTGSDRVAAPADERAEAFTTFFAYSGRYSVSADRVTHHVEIASHPNWVNIDFVRLFSLNGERLVLRTPPLSVGGTVQSSDLTWERVP